METQYIFGRDGDASILETVGDEHTDLSGFFSVSVRNDVDEITHSCIVERKYRSAEGADGLCYDWYAIHDYYRDTDRTPRTDARVAELEAENKLLREQVSALSDQNDFQEELIVELANVVYA